MLCGIDHFIEACELLLLRRIATRGNGERLHRSTRACRDIARTPNQDEE
jgi:hypothetical protein